MPSSKADDDDDSVFDCIHGHVVSVEDDVLAPGITMTSDDPEPTGVPEKKKIEVEDMETDDMDNGYTQQDSEETPEHMPSSKADDDDDSMFDGIHEHVVSVEDDVLAPGITMTFDDPEPTGVPEKKKIEVEDMETDDMDNGYTQQDQSSILHVEETTNSSMAMQEEPSKKVNNNSATIDSLIFVLGQTKEVDKFDKTGNRLRAYPNNQKINDEYIEAKVQVGTKLLKSYRIAKKSIKEWEQEYCVNHGGSAPNLEDCKKNKHILKLYKQTKLAAQFLKRWNIDYC
ncbi:uncharacterized protein [Ptychodera flava]|uniref:uncharacterized protein n=1 Tax=Ptychodera flava TaxID=63121 RepID=UPI00396A4930